MLNELRRGLLTETEEQSVHTHGVNTEEPMGDEVGANHHGLRTRTMNIISYNTQEATLSLRVTGRQV